jgi:hypothetical protein
MIIRSIDNSKSIFFAYSSMRATALGVLAHPSDWSTETIRFISGGGVASLEAEVSSPSPQEDRSEKAKHEAIIERVIFIGLSV